MSYIISFLVFRERYNLLVWSTLSTFVKKMFNFSSKDTEMFKINFFQKPFFPNLWCYDVLSYIQCSLTYFVSNEILVKKSLIFAKSIENLFSANITHTFSIFFLFLKNYTLWDFSKFCFYESALSNILFHVLFGFSTFGDLK